MAGAGQDLERLKALAASLNLQDRVLFTGFVGDREEILSLYRRADLLVFPSVYDNAPMVVREAAAKAMTLVTTYTDAWSVGYHVGVLGRGDNYKSPCKHMYVAEPNDVRAALKVVAVDRWGNRYEQSEFTARDDFTDARSPVY